MKNEDTINLLKECFAGIRMAKASLDDALSYTTNDKLKNILILSKEEHEKLENDIHKILNDCRSSPKYPHPVADTMSKMKINIQLSINSSCKTIASLITDGCNMGIKSLNGYLNQYKYADDKTKNITNKLIASEEKLQSDLKIFL